ncbi:hypothetical protein CC85DRAFT_124350 [Cutaneotrichosporon oleaginosum]|uniref:Uncharacterized protein n=1 Tax=Cutaneotrichosporon oleaginosum TaxID=879819 RepID=A0A0J0XK08_9TREE|nr:uncharacterized protein CC85DRAFT_124350 [Cutaneotrichosporon oleaginosum]KLT41397.1 hypothetical protein CC85DRAFT_124350 [Cutaneotrichosporon oleaginosum]TXT06338.1 hypothetical protein COLE_05669 [Cutaneotrichosporon oleaginosum]
MPATITEQMFPHIIDGILKYAMASATYSELIALRRLSRTTKTAIDTKLFTHLTMTYVKNTLGNLKVATPSGRHPALLDSPTPGAKGVYTACLTCIFASSSHSDPFECEQCIQPAWRLHPISANFKAARIVDIVGGTLVDGFKPLSALFNTIDYLRFKSQWGVTKNSASRYGMVWPGHYSRQPLHCRVKNMVWLGDVGWRAGLWCDAMPVVPDAHYIYVWRRPLKLDPYVDVRLEVPAGVGHVTVVYHKPEGEADDQPYDLAGLEPYAEAVARGYTLTAAGLFDAAANWHQETSVESGTHTSAQEQLMLISRKHHAQHMQVTRRLNAVEAAAEFDAGMKRIVTLSLEEYVAGLSDEERAMIMEE